MDKCPWCGAEVMPDEKKCVNDPREWICGTYITQTELEGDRTTLCYQRQIANLKERLEAWREFYQEVIPWIDEADFSGNLLKLKDLGEI